MKRFLFNFVIIYSFSLFSQLFCQVDSTSKEINIKPINLSGPRMGVTYLSESFIDAIKEKHNMDLNPVFLQFGWHFEHRFFSTRNGSTAVSEWILLIGGFEQEKFLPSITWLFGFRTQSGIEFGAGPNLSLSGTSVVIATGITLQFNEINFPINLAVATSKSGPRFTLLVGLNLRQ